MILADTHVVLWLALDHERVSKRAKAAIQETRQNGEPIGISSLTLWEITSLEEKGRVKLKATLETFLSSIEENFSILPISGRICALTRQLPASYPRDPADRIIGATALDQGVPLITADKEIHRSKAVPVIW